MLKHLCTKSFYDIKSNIKKNANKYLDGDNADISNYNPKVFISYSQDNIDFADKILKFSNRLRREGIDIILD